jgi:hypothetical protein
MVSPFGRHEAAKAHGTAVEATHYGRPADAKIAAQLVSKAVNPRKNP